MTVKRIFGDGLTPGSLGPRNVPTLPTSRNAAPPIQINRWVRNVNKHPNAMLENLKNEALNQAALFRTKDYCNLVGRPGMPGVLSAAQDRWRFAFRSGPFAHSSVAHVVVNIPSAGWSNDNGFVQLDLYSDPTESTLVSSTKFHYGPGPTTGGPRHWRVFRDYVDVDPSTDYYAVVRDMNGARVLSLLMFELASVTGASDGYLPQNVSVQNPITDAYREAQVKRLRALWDDGGPKIFNWTTNPGQTWSTGWGPAPNFDYKTTTSATGNNILDYDFFAGGSTAVNANTPGWYPDMRYCKRRAQAGVPCVMKAFGKAGSGSTSGNVLLKDSSGSVVAQISGGWPVLGTPRWKEVSFDLPAVYDKLDVHFSSDGTNTFSLWAVSIYPVG